MEPTNERDTQERKIGPTVSKDKWVNHARGKLSRGYVLIVGTERKNANFYSKEKGYEMCAFNVARQMIKDGLVHKVRDHHLGEVYELIELPVVVDRRKPAAAETTVDDEFEALLNDLDTDRKDDSAEAATETEQEAETDGAI